MEEQWKLEKRNGTIRKFFYPNDCYYIDIDKIEMVFVKKIGND